jgi:hypothetical protein
MIELLSLTVENDMGATFMAQPIRQALYLPSIEVGGRMFM